MRLRITSRKMSAFIQKLNPITGRSEWIIQSEDYDYHQEVARAAFADMLHDTERNILYENAIKLAIERMHAKGAKANVLDIGTGTGLLSMMAVRHGADSVLACEAFKPMGKCALEIIKINGYEEKIRLVLKRSTDLKLGVDFDIKPNILVTEVFDTELIGEGAIDIFRHAHEELLEKDCVVVPHSATIYAQVVESPLLKNWNRIKDVYNEEGEVMLRAPEAISNCAGSISLHDVQLNQFPLEYVKMIVRPQSIFQFDWSGQTSLNKKRSVVNTIKAECDGEAQGVFIWWDLNMDIENKIVLSCAPYWAHPSGDRVTPWRDHWMQAIYYFPKEVKVSKGEEVQLVSCHDEFSLWFYFDTGLNSTIIEPPHCQCNLHNAFSHTRIGQLNDGRRSKKYLKVFERCIQKDSTILIISHGFYQALSVAKIAKHIYYLESNAVISRFLKNFIIENNLENVTVLENANDLEGKEKIDYVVSEPYFITSILPWDNLLLLYTLKDFLPYLHKDVQILPQQAMVRAVAVQFDNLHKIRKTLGSCQDFKMGPFDKLIEASSEISDGNVEAQPLWEYPCKALTGIQDIASIELKIHETGFTVNNEGTFKSVDKCNGIVLWVDWVLDRNNPSHSTVTTGPIKPFDIGEYISWDMHTRQGVCLLGDKDIKNELGYSFEFSFDAGVINFKTFIK